jgi:hypothetical protein
MRLNPFHDGFTSSGQVLVVEAEEEEVEAAD